MKKKNQISFIQRHKKKKNCEKKKKKISGKIPHWKNYILNFGANTLMNLQFWKSNIAKIQTKMKVKSISTTLLQKKLDKLKKMDELKKLKKCEKLTYEKKKKKV